MAKIADTNEKIATYSHFFAESKRRASNIVADVIEGRTAG